MKLPKTFKDYRSFKKIYHLITSKTFIWSFVFATALWAYTSLNQEYRANVTVPLTINLPSNRSFAVAPPQNITLSVKGSGWQIFTMYMSSPVRCTIDLDRNDFSGSAYEITRDNIMKNIEYLDYVQAVDVIPDHIKIMTGSIGEYTVKIKPNIVVQMKPGYAMIGGIEIFPEGARIKGNDEIVKEITSWSTKYVVFKDCYKSFTTIVDLEKSMSGMISVYPKSVKIRVNIQQITDLEVPDVPVKIRGGDYLTKDIVEPLTVTLTLRGGIDEMKNLDYNAINVYVEYQKIIADSTGILRPVISVPNNLKVVKMDPPYLYHKIRE